MKREVVLRLKITDGDSIGEILKITRESGIKIAKFVGRLFKDYPQASTGEIISKILFDDSLSDSEKFVACLSASYIIGTEDGKRKMLYLKQLLTQISMMMFVGDN